MTTLHWIVASGLVMAAIALLGIVLLLLGERLTERLLLPLVALAAGTLIGSAFFHMVPASLERVSPAASVWPLVVLGFAAFLGLEQLLHWHRGHGAARASRPVVYLVLLGDGLHNLIDGTAIASAFLIDVRLGVSTFIAAAAHEIPQELGDFAVLLHAGWSKRKALVWNGISALTFLAGGLLTYAASDAVDVSYLVPFAAGGFLYIGATDLVPELNKVAFARRDFAHFTMFLAGAALMYVGSVLE
ncbi:MAG TPA: ZIP family metal transporter [Gammaproteobacteria bacterium]